MQWAATTWSALPFDADAARAFGRAYAATRRRTHCPEPLRRSGNSRDSRCNGLPLYTRNLDDFAALEAILPVVEV